MFKRALLKCDCIIKQPALKTLSNRAKESRNIQSTAVNNVQKIKKKSLKIFFKIQKCSSSSFEGYPLQVRYKQDWGRRFILLHVQPQAATLSESDTGSGVIKQHRVSSSKTVRPRALCGARCIHVGHAVNTWSAVCSERRHTRNSVKERDPVCAWTNGIAQHQSAGG